MTQQQFYDKMISRMDKMCGTLEKIARTLESMQKKNDVYMVNTAVNNAEDENA